MSAAGRLAAWSRRHPRWTGFLMAVAATVVSIAAVDKPLVLYLSADLGEDWRGFFDVITNVGLAGRWYLLAITCWAFCRMKGAMALMVDAADYWRGWARSWGFVVVAMLTSGVAIHVLKFAFGRYRPKEMLNPDTVPLYGFVPFSGEQGFPSGHSQAIWSACVALSVMFPRHRWWLWSLATMVSVSRVMTANHYSADVIMGSAVGILVTLWIRDRYAARAPLTVTRPLPPAPFSQAP